MGIRSEQPRSVRSGIAALAAAVLVVMVAPTVADAAPPYPPNPPQQSIPLGAVGVVCESDAPYISYEITPEGFPPAEIAALVATLTVLDSSGDPVPGSLGGGPFAGQPLEGRVLYPGASVDANGVGNGWPGWKQENGQWVEDPDTQFLRTGLLLNAVVNPESTVAVQYPAETAPCMNPAGESPQGFTNTNTGTLPSTGASGPEQTLVIAAVALLAGVLITGVAWRRRETPVADA